MRPLLHLLPRYHPLRMIPMNLSSSTPIVRRIALGSVTALALAVMVGCSGSHAETAAPPPPQVTAAPVLI